MIRLSILALLSLAAAPAVLACEGEEAKSGEGCHMPASATATAELPKGGTHTKLAVTGMECGACADKVHAALIGVEGVKGARIDLAANVAEVAYDAKKTNLDKLVAAVAATGKFTATVATN